MGRQMGSEIIPANHVDKDARTGEWSDQLVEHTLYCLGTRVPNCK